MLASFVVLACLYGQQVQDGITAVGNILIGTNGLTTIFQSGSNSMVLQAGPTGARLTINTNSISIGTNVVVIDGAVNSPSIGFASEPTNGLIRLSGGIGVTIANSQRAQIVSVAGGGQVAVSSSGSSIQFGMGSTANNPDTGWTRDGAGVIAQRFGASGAIVAGTNRVYGRGFGSTNGYFLEIGFDDGLQMFAVRANTNATGTTAGTNYPLVLSVTTNINNGIVIQTDGSLIFRGVTNQGSIQLPVQNAKLPSTNNAAIDGGWQDWELLYARTNASGSLNTNSATWQIVMPQDYRSNTMSIRVLSTITATNGPNSSNVIFRVSALAVNPGSSTDARTGTFSAVSSGTNTWAASNTVTNQIKSLSISMAGNTGNAQAGDLVIIKLERDGVTDTYNNASAVVGVSLDYLK